jgi:hypothetical protein
MTGTLFVACIILRQISAGIEDLHPGRIIGEALDGICPKFFSSAVVTRLAFSKTYVISLPRRADRRAQMDTSERCSSGGLDVHGCRRGKHICSDRDPTTSVHPTQSSGVSA